jgi:hypothetical protein
MTLPPTADQDAPPAPPLETETKTLTGWRRFLDNEPLIYALTFCVMVGGCLLVPKLLNNMIFVIVMMGIGIVAVPMLLKRWTGTPESDIDRKGAEH